MNKILLLLFAVGIIIGGYFSFRTDPTSMTPARVTLTDTLSPTIVEKVSYRAGFMIFTHGTQRIFSDTKYHNQSQDVFIQAENPNIIHTTKKDTKWQDFFNTLPMQLSKDCLVTGTKQTFCSNNDSKLRFFINGIEDSDALNKIISHKDQLLVTYGISDQAIIKNQLKQLPVIE